MDRPHAVQLETLGKEMQYRMGYKLANTYFGAKPSRATNSRAASETSGAGTAAAFILCGFSSSERSYRWFFPLRFIFISTNRRFRPARHISCSCFGRAVHPRVLDAIRQPSSSTTRSLNSKKYLEKKRKIWSGIQ